MTSYSLKSTYLPERVLSDYVAEVFGQDNTSADFAATIVHRPLLVLPPLSAPRRFLIRVVNSVWFTGIILLLIVVNSVFLALDDPNVQTNTVFNQALCDCDLAFLIIFTLEMVLKMGAYGVFFHSRSYLRDPWNLLDCFVVITGLVTIGISGLSCTKTGASALRVVRVFRPLRTVSKVQSLKHILTKVMQSLPSMRDVFVLLIFVSWLAAIAGVQLFLGALDRRCYADATFYDPVNRSASALRLTNTTEPDWLLIQNFTRKCNPSQQDRTCRDSMVSLPVSCRSTSQYESNVLTFNNVWWGLLLATKIVSRDNWPEDLDNIVYASSPFAFIFFLVLTFFGGYFCLNLFIAVLTGAFGQGEEDDTVMIEERVTFAAMLGGGIVADAACFSVHHSAGTMHAVERHLEGSDCQTLGGSTRPPTPVTQAQAAVEASRKVTFNDPALLSEGTTPASTSTGPAVEPSTLSLSRRVLRLSSSGRLRRTPDGGPGEPSVPIWDRIVGFFQRTGVGFIRKIVTSTLYDALIMLVIFANAVVLSLDSYKASSGIATTVQSASFYFNIIFLGDVLLKLLGLGPSYFVDGANWFDLGLALASIPDLINANSSALSALRAFRLVRLLRLARRWRSLQQLITLVMVSVQSVASLSLVSLIIIYIYAILGFQLFGYDIPDSRFSFENVFDSLLTVFVIVTGENWASMMKETMEAKGYWTVLYFLSLFVIGNFFITNLFIAIIIDNFNAVTEEGDDDFPAGDADDAMATDMMMARLATARDTVLGMSRRNVDTRVFLDPSSDDETVLYDEDYDPDGNVPLVPRAASHSALLDRAGSPEDDPARRSQRLQAAELIAGRLDLNTADEVAVVQEFAQEFGMAPTNVSIVGNPAELRARAEKELLQLETTRRGQRRHRKRLEDVVSSAVARIRNPPKAHIPQHLQLTDHRKARPRTVTLAERELMESEWSGLKHSSFICVSRSNRLRIRVGRVLRHHVMQVLLVILTLVSSVSLALDDDDITGGADTTFAKVIAVLDYIIAACFCIELALKMFALGLVGHKGAYFRNVWNVVDFVVTCAAVVALFVPAAKPILALRALRLTSLSFSMKVVVTALLSALPGMGSVLVFMGLLWWIYAVLGVALFKGLFFECNDGVSAEAACTGFFNQTVLETFGYGTELMERQWYSPLESSKFDNIFEALYSLLKLALSDGWFNMMYYAVDSPGIGEAKSKNSYQLASLYFISFMIIGNFFTINLFVGVLANRFVTLRQKGEGFHLISENQRQWVMAQKVLFRSQINITPEEPKNPARYVCFVICQHWLFDAFFTGLIIANSVVLSMYYSGMSQRYEDALDITGLTILSLFTVEAAMKVTAYNPVVFWRNQWNRLDICVVILSWVGVIIGNGVSAIRLFRVARLFLLLRKMKGVQTMFISLYQAIPELINVGVVLMVVYFLFAVLGVFFFDKVGHTGPLNDHVNFDHIGNALITLYIATTTEGWADIADALNLREPDCSNARGDCGSWVAYPYMIIFMIVMALILMNLLVTVVLGNFLDAQVAEGQESLFEVIESFRERWTEYDPTGTQRVDVGIILRLLPTLPSSIWDRAVPKIRGKQRSVWIHFLRQLEKFYIPLGKDHTVHYIDAIATIAFRLFCIPVADAIEASQRTSHGVTWKGRQLSVHQHFAAIKVTRAVRHYLNTRGERILAGELRELREQHAIMLDVEYEPLRRSHRDTTVLCRWLIGRLAEERATKRDNAPAAELPPAAAVPQPQASTARRPGQLDTVPYGSFASHSGSSITSPFGAGGRVSRRRDITAVQPRIAMRAVPAAVKRSSVDAGASGTGESSPREVPVAPLPVPSRLHARVETPPTDANRLRFAIDKAASTTSSRVTAPPSHNSGSPTTLALAALTPPPLSASPSAEVAALHLERHRGLRRLASNDPFLEELPEVHPPSTTRRVITPCSSDDEPDHPL
jgi:hypothetical protein